MAEVRDAADGGSGWTAPADGSKRMKAEADLKTAPKHQSRGGGQDAVAAPDSLLAALRAVLMQLTCGQHSRFVMLWPTPLAARHGPGSALLHIQQRCTGRCCLEGPGRTSSCGGGLNARRHGSGSVCCPTPLLLCQRAATCSHRPYPPSALCCQVAVRRMQSFSPQAPRGTRALPPPAAMRASRAVPAEAVSEAAPLGATPPPPPPAADRRASWGFQRGAATSTAPGAISGPIRQGRLGPPLGRRGGPRQRANAGTISRSGTRRASILASSSAAAADAGEGPLTSLLRSLGLYVEDYPEEPAVATHLIATCSRACSLGARPPPRRISLRAWLSSF